LYDIIKLMTEQTATEDEEAISRVHVATSYHDGHCYSRFHSTGPSIGILEKWQIRGMSVLSREIRWRITLVSTENIEGETGRKRMGKQRRSMNVAEKSPPHTSGNKHQFFLHKELPTEEPLASTCLHHVPFHTQLRYV
jgi:hypothetical protein